MARSSLKRNPGSPSAALDLDQALERIASLNKDELRALWRQAKGQEPPTALSKDLIARALAHRLQEEHFGGINAQVRKKLAAFATGATEPSRYVKTGSIIIREYQGRLHQVVVVPEGFLWQGQIYTSLSTIARKITGTSWNGPRFFGLRGKAEKQAGNLEDPAEAHPLERGSPLAGRISPKRAPTSTARKQTVSTRGSVKAARGAPARVAVDFSGVVDQ